MATTVLVLRLVLAGVFVLAAVGKLRDLEGSRRAVADFGVPIRAAAWVGVALPLAELGTAVALVIAPTARVGAILALALLLAFMAGILRALRRGEAPDCNCFGQVHSAPAGRGTLARNAVLAALAGVILAEGPGPGLIAWIEDRGSAELVAIAAAIAALALALLFAAQWRVTRKLRDDLGTARRIAATAAPGIPIGSQAPGFEAANLEGEPVSLESLRAPGLPILLAFVSPSCPSCVELLPKLSGWQRTLSERLTIAFVTSGTADQNRDWAREHGCSNVLIQEGLGAIEAYRIRGAPSALIITTDGKVGSNPAESVFGIEPLVRLALRDGADSQVARTPAV